MLKHKRKRRTRPEIERFMEKVSVTGGCWEWEASLSHQGYGQFSINSLSGLAHRFSYQHFVGEIPDGMEIDHLCRNRKCVNPAHLEAVTTRENTRRGMLVATLKAKAMARTHCNRGHEWTPRNTRVGSDGARYCKVCQAAAANRWKVENRGRINELQQARRLSGKTISATKRETQPSLFSAK